ncbi:unnamed protein product, partial [Ectocarpus sp. 12 AP-2014]
RHLWGGSGSNDSGSSDSNDHSSSGGRGADSSSDSNDHSSSGGWGADSSSDSNDHSSSGGWGSDSSSDDSGSGDGDNGYEEYCDCSLSGGYTPRYGDSSDSGGSSDSSDSGDGQCECECEPAPELECCADTIVEDGEMCDIFGSAPCVLGSAPAPTPVAEPVAPVTEPTDVCSNGIPGVQSGVSCCLAECGGCGGSGCAELGGGLGEHNCCEGDIEEFGELCSIKLEAPCVVDASAPAPSPIAEPVAPVTEPTGEKSVSRFHGK